MYNHIGNTTTATTICTTNNHAISDRGSTKIFIVVNTKVKNKTHNLHPIRVTVPNDKQIYTTHTCELDISELPLKARLCHVLPGLRQYSLISIAQLCDARCKVLFDSYNCQFFHNKKLILSGPRDLKISLWFMPLNTQLTQLQRQYTPRAAVENSVLISIPLPKLLKYIHQCCFSLCPSTRLKGITNNQFTTCPGVTTKNVSKYLLASVALAKGHIDRVLKHLRSMKSLYNKPHNEVDFHPPQEPKAHAFIGAIIDLNNHTTKA